MSTKKIEQLIDDLYEYIESCKPKGFSGTQVIVQKEEIFDMLDEMRLKIPDEIKRCQKMVAQRDAILADAEERANAMIEEANRRVDAIVSENEIMRQAYLQANDLMGKATDEANNRVLQAEADATSIRKGAFDYTNQMLEQIEIAIGTAYNDTRIKTEAMLESLRQNLEIVTQNRRELLTDISPESSENSEEKVEETEYEQDEDSEQEDESEEQDEFDRINFMKNVDD